MSGHDCAELLAKLNQYIDGELDSSSCVDIRAHMEACSPCLHHADIEAAFKKLVARSCRESAPAGFLERMKGLLD